MGRVPLTERVRVDIPVGAEAAYDMISDHAALAAKTPHIKTVKVKSTRPDLYLAEERLVLGGREYLCMVRHRRRPPHTHEYTVVGGDAKGSRVVERFRDIPGGTRVTVDIDWKYGLRGMAGRGGMLNDYADMLRAAWRD